MLPRCLETLVNVADEVVVVDTGSSDNTVQLAQEAGAHVFHQPWQDDFSAPRNLAVAQARGRWVLLLDADERLGTASGAALLAAIAQDDFDCGLLPLRDAASLHAEVEAVLSGSAALDQGTLLPRLFRRTDDLRWQGVIHEHVNRWLARGSKRVRTVSGAVIAHYGGVPEYRRLRGKSERNLKLLRKRCAEPDVDSAALGYLAYALHDRGQAQDCFETIARAWQMLREEMAALGPDELAPSSVSIAVLYGSFLRERGRLGAAIDVLEQCLSWNLGKVDEGHPGVLFQLGGCHEAAAVGLPDDARVPEFLKNARESYAACIAASSRLFLETVNPTECTGVLGWTRLGTVALVAEQYPEAELAFDSANSASAEPANSEPHIELGAEWQLGRAEAALGTGHPRLCLEMLAGVDCECADVASLAALAHRALGEPGPTLRFAKQAVQQMRDRPFIASHRQRRLLALCESMQGVQGRVG